jgi:hypothetical protein
MTCHPKTDAHFVNEREVATKIEKGEPVTAPGVPQNFPDAKQLVTEDCIRPNPPHDGGMKA